MTPTPPSKLPRGKGFRRLGRAPKSVLRAYRLTLDPPLILDGVRVNEDDNLRGQRAAFLAARRDLREQRSLTPMSYVEAEDFLGDAYRRRMDEVTA